MPKMSPKGIYSQYYSLLVMLATSLTALFIITKITANEEQRHQCQHTNNNVTNNFWESLHGHHMTPRKSGSLLGVLTLINTRI